MNTEKKSYKALLIAFAIGVAAATILLVSLQALIGRLTRSEFCGTACHEMTGVYKGWLVSSHHNNSAGMITECVDCHLPPKEQYVARFADEIYEGSKNLYLHFFGTTYDANSNQERVVAKMPDARCLKCHNNLMGKPSSIASQIAHEAGLNKADPNAPRCMDCHAVMHKRPNP